MQETGEVGTHQVQAIEREVNIGIYVAWGGGYLVPWSSSTIAEK